MSIRLTGKEVALSIYKRTSALSERVRREKGRPPVLAIVRVGEKGADLAYERGVRKNAQKAGVEVKTTALREDVQEEKLKSTIISLNKDGGTDGILLFLPLPKRFDEAGIVNLISPEKDVDGATDASRLSVYTGSGSGFAPCTPQAVVEMMHYYKIPIRGKRAVIVGRSLVVGKPLAMLLLKENATVTVCHTRTEDLPSVTQEADLLVSAAGHIGTIGREHVRKEQCVFDVGINMTPEGKMTGDVLYDEVSPLVHAITPVPGGVGAVTTSVLMLHTAEAALS